jgi:secondary thiamine-phosphate synthase enzyme
MRILTETITLETDGYCDIRDITPQVSEAVRKHELQDGTVTIFVPGATGGVTTVEYEPGLIRDIPLMFEKLAPQDGKYHHDMTWQDGNGFSHVRASLLGPSLTIPFTQGRLTLGTWQQVVVVDFDNKSRNRRVVIQVMGE